MTMSGYLRTGYLLAGHHRSGLRLRHPADTRPPLRDRNRRRLGRNPAPERSDRRRHHPATPTDEPSRLTITRVGDCGAAPSAVPDLRCRPHQNLRNGSDATTPLGMPSPRQCNHQLSQHVSSYHDIRIRNPFDSYDHRRRSAVPGTVELVVSRVRSAGDRLPASRPRDRSLRRRRGRRVSK